MIFMAFPPHLAHPPGFPRLPCQAQGLQADGNQAAKHLGQAVTIIVATHISQWELHEAIQNWEWNYPSLLHIIDYAAWGSFIVSTQISQAA